MRFAVAGWAAPPTAVKPEAAANVAAPGRARVAVADRSETAARAAEPVTVVTDTAARSAEVVAIDFVAVLDGVRVGENTSVAVVAR